MTYRVHLYTKEKLDEQGLTIEHRKSISNFRSIR